MKLRLKCVWLFVCLCNLLLKLLSTCKKEPLEGWKERFYAWLGGKLNWLDVLIKRQ